MAPKRVTLETLVAERRFDKANYVDLLAELATIAYHLGTAYACKDEDELQAELLALSLAYARSAKG